MIDYYYDHPDARKFPDYWEKKAASRLKLLRRLNANRIFNVNQCPFCLGMPDSTWELGCEPETADRHTDDCELAEELDDE